MNIVALIEDPSILLMYSAIILFNGISVYYTIRWILELRKRFTSLVVSIKILHGITSLCLGSSYVYSLVRILMGNQIEINLYGETVIRPIILMASFYMAVSAKVRHYLGNYREDSCQKQ
jgi:hypothetical protein